MSETQEKTSAALQDFALLLRYRWSVREREMLRQQLEDLDSLWYRRPDPRGKGQFMKARERRRAACEEALRQREVQCGRDAEAFERLMEGVRMPRTRLVLRQYYGMGMSDREIGEANGFSTRTAGSVRNEWLREHGCLEAPPSGRRFS